MNNNWIKSILTLHIFVLCFGFSPFPLLAQNNDSEDIEVYLDLRHRGVVNSVITSYYKDDRFFLPISELFSLFKIDHTTQGLTVEGRFSVEQTSYRIDLQNNRIHFGRDSYNITADDYLVKELDLYLRPSLFYEIFGLDFTIDFNNLTLNLNTDQELPIVQQALRKQRRSQAYNNLYSEEKHELKFERQKPFLDGGFVDYNLSANINSSRNVYNYNTNIGMQVYGGDLQGNIFGSYSENYKNLATSNLRWRYMYRDQPWLSKLTIGQNTTDGFSRNSYTGIRLTNEPIEPRRLFDEFEIQGNTIPESEVELYINNSLVDFEQADEMGNYRFLTPVSYGSSQLNLKIFGPSGQVLERSNRIQVPFTFQPKGVFNYNINMGQLDNPIIGSTEQELTVQGNGAYGISNWLTAKAGVEYYGGYHEKLPTFTSTLSSRIFDKYLLTFEGATNAYYRGILNVIYPNSASINLDYTDFTSGFGVYNPSNDDKRLVTSAFYPFNLFGLPFNLRVSAFSRIRTSTSSTTFRLDANSRLGKLNLRLGYNDRFTGSPDFFNPTNTANIESSATYNISRNPNLPEYLRGVFLRAQMRYLPHFNRVESAEFLVSQNVFKQGRFQLSLGRNFAGNFNNIRFSLILDFNKTRSSTTFSNMRNSSNFTQNIRGSVGYDTNYNNFLFTSRDQVGRSGAAIKLFVDNNANNIFDEGDDSIHENAVRINRSGSSSISKNGILYYTQMQPYYHYNMEMNKSAIKNPMLVPEMEKFGMITDPNRFKKIEIPFYMSGVIEGVVERQYSEKRKGGVGGLKLILTQADNDYSKEIRTFSDGSFYAYEIPPGEYELRIDSTQLDILKSKANPGVRRFEVKAIPEGDFVEGLHFLLLPDTDIKTPEATSITSNIGAANIATTAGGLSVNFQIPVDSLQVNQCKYAAQLGAFSTAEAAELYIQKLSTVNNLFVVYNKPANMYMIRKNLQHSFGEASRLTNKIASDHRIDVVVINQCNNPNNRISGTVQFDLQTGALSDSSASTLAENLRQKYNLESFQAQDTTLISDFNITKNKLPAPVINADYKYMLYLGEFKNNRAAALYALRIEEEFNLKSKVLIDENNTATLVLDETFEKWNQVLNLKNKIASNNAFQSPIIHLLEFDL